jgi:subtilase family serine protease
VLFPAAVYVFSDDHSSVIDSDSIRQRRTRKIEAAVGAVDQHESDMPTFQVLEVQGSPPPLPQPPNNGTGQENHFAWAVEVSLDVEWAHATAPGANIILVTTPTAETLGVRGFSPMMNAVQYVADHHLADIISMSLGAGEGTFANGQVALLQLRGALVDAQANGITVLASSGDGGTTNPLKEPVKNLALIPYPSVGWPVSDPLVTGVGGTRLCADPSATTMRTTDNTDPPTVRQVQPAETEIGWPGSGGGYSILFPRPPFQDTLPADSSYIGSSVGALARTPTCAECRTWHIRRVRQLVL